MRTQDLGGHSHCGPGTPGTSPSSNCASDFGLVAVSGRAAGALNYNGDDNGLPGTNARRQNVFQDPSVP